MKRRDGPETAIIRHQLMILLLRLAREARSEPARHRSRETEIYPLFSRELEAKFVTRMSALDYARNIGVSESTLSRACLGTVGRTLEPRPPDARGMPEVYDARIVMAVSMRVRKKFLE